MQGLERSQLRALSRRSDARGLVQLGGHVGLLTLTGILVCTTRGTPWWMPVLVVHGIALDFLFCAQHEAVHRTAFASRRLNDAVAWACGVLLLLPPEYFRLFHFAHHRFTQDPALDPELGQPPPARLSSYLWRVTGLPNWYQRVAITLGHALTGRVSERFVPPVKRPLIVREARLLLSLYLAVLLISCILRRADALIYWVVPAILGQPFLRLYLMAEHGGCALGDDVYANTRTTRSTGLVRWLAWQMPYHVEHHAYPSVPFHALAAVHGLMGARIEMSAPGYVAFHRALIRSLLAPTRLARPGATAPTSPSTR